MTERTGARMPDRDDAMVTLDELRQLATAAVDPPGEPLDAIARSLIRLGVAASMTSLDRAAVASAIADTLDAGATIEQAQEIVSLISALGVHSLMVASSPLLAQGIARGLVADEGLNAAQQALWDTHVGDDPFWSGMEREFPGFLRAMLILSPDQFAAFFGYCAVPWKSGRVRARIKELAAMASDATPAHRFLPGFRLHLANAVMLGAGRLAIDEALAIGAAAPAHTGTR